MHFWILVNTKPTKANTATKVNLYFLWTLVRHTHKHIRTSLNIFKHFWVNSNIFKHFRNFSNIFEYFWLFSNIFEHFRTFSNIFKHFQTFSNIFERFRTFSRIVISYSERSVLGKTQIIDKSWTQIGSEVQKEQGHKRAESDNTIFNFLGSLDRGENRVTRCVCKKSRPKWSPIHFCDI
jgi:hypothetical protein